MSASISFSESNGSGESVHDTLTNLNFGSNDSPNLVTATYPVVIGAYSFEKYLRIKVAGSFTSLTNMKFWKSAGTYVTDEVINAIANQTFTQPITTVSSKAVSPIPTAVGSALAIQSTETPNTAFTQAGYSKYIVMQTASSVSTPTGAAAEKTFTVQWDEQ